MRQVVLYVPENKYRSFIKIVKSLEYVSLPKKDMKRPRNLAEKFRSKIPGQIAMEMHRQLDEMRNEWERDI